MNWKCAFLWPNCLESRGYSTRNMPRAFVMPTGRIKDRRHFHLILLDIRMPDGNGVDFLNVIKAMDRSVPVLMVSAYASVENVVRAMKYGAVNFYSKPIDMPVPSGGSGQASRPGRSTHLRSSAVW
jgi:DNA-binding NtrC family response regulator